MATHIRKLLLPLEDHNPTFYSSASNQSSETSKAQETENHTYNNINNSNNNYTTSSTYSNFKLNPPFDSAMALTVLVLLTALFFMGFFSIYIRRFADESSVDPTRRRRTTNLQSSSSNTMPYYSSSRIGGCSSKGVDPTVVKSLPVHPYFPGEVNLGIIEQEMECAICLSEFQEKEWVKEIPYCGHVFHVECIDTWLESHVTCPLCRTAKLVEVVVEESEKQGVGHVGGDGEESGGGDTWREVEREVGPTSERRRRSSSTSSSCVWFGERLRLHRSLSF